jgi:hypothetical protein
LSDKIRLLICKECGTVEELPMYDGPAETDSWLKSFAEPHQYPSGTRHIGQLAIVQTKDWQSKYVREDILSEVYKRFSLPGTGDGLGSEFYDLKSTFLDDAFQCWKRFKRPSDPSHCDYRKDNKILLPDTKAERKAEGLDVKDRPNTFLCDFCPVQSIVSQRQREAAGAYK